MKPALIAGVIGVAVGLAVGIMITRPSEDWRTWKAEVERYQRDTVAYVARQDSLARSRDSALARADSAVAASRRSQAQADRERSLRLAYRDSANHFKNLLELATTPADSLQACIGELGLRRKEISTCERETANLRTAIANDSTALRNKDKALKDEQLAHSATKARLFKADSLLTNSPAPGCSLPLCAAISLDLEPWDRTFFVGVSIPIRTWIRSGVLRRVTK